MTEVTPPPAPLPAASNSNKGLGIASLVLGILSLCASFAWWCGGPISIVGLILGALGIKSSARSLAIVGMVLSAVGLLSVLVFRFVFRGIILNDLFNRFLSGIGL